MGVIAMNCSTRPL